MAKQRPKLKVFKPKSRQLSSATPTVLITDLNDEGKGVARAEDGKAIFVVGALPGERVIIKYTQHKKQYDEAVVLKMIIASPHRVVPSCEYYGRCGGCDYQHLSYEQQLAIKNAQLQRLFAPLQGRQERLIKWEKPVSAGAEHYRHRARFSVTANKKGVLLGFKQSSSHQLIDVETCLIADNQINALLPAVRALLTGLQSRSSIVECVLSVDSSANVSLIFVSKYELVESDYQQLAAYSSVNAVAMQVSLHSRYYDAPLFQSGLEVFNYQVDEQLTLNYQATDFTQVNPAINQLMIGQVLSWLDVSKSDNVLDYFCGVGNLTLPIAREVNQVVGYELVKSMVDKASANACGNSISNAGFRQIDLFSDEVAIQKGFNKVVLDPPRAGAANLCSKQLPAEVECVLYISCNPSTLVRDAEFLQQQGFTITRASLLDMFPHTKHIESMLLMQRLG